MCDPDGWNPAQAGAEMADLFRQADAILSKPIYQDREGSTPATNQDAAFDQTTEEQSQGLTPS